MSEKILVTYASEQGATTGVAKAIGRAMSEKGLAVDVRPVGEVSDLSGYRAVVAGSAIHGGKWLPEALQFVRDHRDELARKPFAAFLVCITLGSAHAEQNRAGVSTWLEPVRTLVRPVSEGLFAGSLNLGQMPFNLTNIGFRIAVKTGLLAQGDHRDWNEVRAWADALAVQLA